MIKQTLITYIDLYVEQLADKYEYLSRFKKQRTILDIILSDSDRANLLNLYQTFNITNKYNKRKRKIENTSIHIIYIIQSKPCWPFSTTLHFLLVTCFQIEQALLTVELYPDSYILNVKRTIFVLINIKYKYNYK